MAYGIALAKLGDVCPRVIALDADTKNSTFSEKMLDKHPEQFIECFIAEQNMVSVAVGVACRNRAIPFTRLIFSFIHNEFQIDSLILINIADREFHIKEFFHIFSIVIEFKVINFF